MMMITLFQMGLLFILLKLMVMYYPQYKGSGTLEVEKGYEFVYALCNIILPGDTLVIRNTRCYVIAVVGDMFVPSSNRDRAGQQWRIQGKSK